MYHKQNIINVDYDSVEGYNHHFSVTYSIELEESGHGRYDSIDILNVDFLGESVTSILAQRVLSALQLRIYMYELDVYSRVVMKKKKHEQD